MKIEDLVKLIKYINEENRTEKTVKEHPHLPFSDFKVIKGFIDEHKGLWNLCHDLQRILEMKDIEWKK